jgi:hypothetical protein
MINTSVIQLQLLLNQPSFNVRLSTNIRKIDISPHGNKRKVEGFDEVAMLVVFE